MGQIITEKCVSAIVKVIPITFFGFQSVFNVKQKQMVQRLGTDFFAVFCQMLRPSLRPTVSLHRRIEKASKG